MRTGKISENTLKRSVLKNTITLGDKIINGASLRDNCAVFSYDKGEYCVVSTHQVLLPNYLDSVRFSIIRGANNIAASHALPQAIELSILLPADFEEPNLAEIMKTARDTSKQLNLSLAGGSTKTDPRINVPVISVTVIGTREVRDLCEVRPEWDVVLTKQIGLAGTYILAKEKEEELKKRYPARYIDGALDFDKNVSILPEAATATKSFVCRLFNVSEGGIFASLWETARMAGVGLDIDLKKIPICQETVEVCDYLDINPYELMSDGSLFIMTPDGENLACSLQERGIPATVIGKTTADNGKVIHNEDEIRYVDKPAADEIYKLFE